jgi:hypothetical protein
MSFLLSFGLSAPNRMRIRVRFCVRVAVGFSAQFVCQVFRVLNLYHTTITTVCKQSIKQIYPFLFLAILFLGKCLLGKCLSGQMSFWANVLQGKCLLGKCLSWQMLSGQMSSGQMLSGQMSFWANFFLGKCRLGKCPRQTSYGQMSLGKCRMGKRHGPFNHIVAGYGSELRIKTPTIPLSP